MASQPLNQNPALAELIAIHKQQAELLVKRRVLDALKQVKTEFKPVASITDTIEKIRTAEYQLGALMVIDKILDVIG